MAFGIAFGSGLIAAMISVVFLAAGGFVLGVMLAIAAVVLLVVAYRRATSP